MEPGSSNALESLEDLLGEGWSLVLEFQQLTLYQVNLTKGASRSLPDRRKCELRKPSGRHLYLDREVRK